MGKKYIVKLDDNKMAYTAIIIDGVPYIKPLQLLPYTEPDTNEVYQRGYDDAKHECTDCQKIMMDAEQERVDKACQHGLNVAWECMKKITHIVTDQGTMINLFGCRTFGTLLEKYTPSECIEKLRQYEQEKEIQVGDEVLFEDEKGVVIVPEENGHYAAAFTAGGMRICEPDYKLRKTGKHYPEIVKVLQEMRKK